MTDELCNSLKFEIVDPNVLNLTMAGNGLNIRNCLSVAKTSALIPPGRFLGGIFCITHTIPTTTFNKLLPRLRYFRSVIYTRDVVDTAEQISGSNSAPTEC